MWVIRPIHSDFRRATVPFMSNTSRTRIALAVAIVGAGTLVGAGVAGAQSDPYVAPTSTVKEGEVLSETTVKAGGEVKSETTEASLALTGGDAAGLATIGGVAVAAGAAITVARRRSAAV
jgi:hypothetical protein